VNIPVAKKNIPVPRWLRPVLAAMGRSASILVIIAVRCIKIV
jgi:CHASE1-domain containing sensor protein